MSVRPSPLTGSLPSHLASKLLFSAMVCMDWTSRDRSLFPENFTSNEGGSAETQRFDFCQKPNLSTSQSLLGHDHHGATLALKGAIERRQDRLDRRPFNVGVGGGAEEGGAGGRFDLDVGNRFRLGAVAQ